MYTLCHSHKHSSTPLQSTSWQKTPSGMQVLQKKHSRERVSSSKLNCWNLNVSHMFCAHVHLFYHCLHSPCSQVSPKLSAWLSRRQRGGQVPGLQDLCWTSSKWQCASSASGVRDLAHSMEKGDHCSAWLTVTHAGLLKISNMLHLHPLWRK